MKGRVFWRRMTVVAMVLLCAAVISFLRMFTHSKPASTIVEWRSAAIVAPDGSSRPCDLAELMFQQPELSEGEFFLFTATIGEVAEYDDLLLELSGATLSLQLDGTELLASENRLLPEATGLTQARIPLPTSASGKTLTLSCRPLDGPMVLFPPYLRLSNSLLEDAEHTAYANHYGIPAGALGLTFLLVCLLFFRSLLAGNANWSLLALALAAATLTVHWISTGCGYAFLSPALNQFFTRNTFMYLAPGALLVYLLLNRKRAFWRLLGRVSLVSGGILVILGVISRLRDGYLFSLMKELWLQLISGYPDGTVYWVTIYLLGACALIAAWVSIEEQAKQRAEADALALRTELAMKSYRAIEENSRRTALLRHELKNKITALDLMYQQGDLEGLGASLAELDQLQSGLIRTQFTGNFTINAILQDAAARAADRSIRFEAQVSAPDQLPIPESDLCALLMNMLDNAIEGAAQVDDPDKRFLSFHCHTKNGFLAIRCDNAYSGKLTLDSEGHWPRSTKEEDELHGFGLRYMNTVAEKYHSMLDLSYTEQTFTVQTALKLPK